jgi:hypothetical protein
MYFWVKNTLKNHHCHTFKYPKLKTEKPTKHNILERIIKNQSKALSWLSKPVSSMTRSRTLIIMYHLGANQILLDECPNFTRQGDI